MERQELLEKISERSGIDFDTCKKVMDVFYEPCEHTGESLVDRIRAMKHIPPGVLGNLPTGQQEKQYVVEEHHASIPAEISEKTGISLDDCEKVLHALKDELDPGIIERIKALLHRN